MTLNNTTDIDVNDRFMLGGVEYTIIEIETNDFGEQVINAIPHRAGNIYFTVQLIIPKGIFFETTN